MGASKFEPSAFASIVCESTGVHLKLNRKFGALFVCVPLVVRASQFELFFANSRNCVCASDGAAVQDRIVRFIVFRVEELSDLVGRYLRYFVGFLSNSALQFVEQK